MIKEKATKSFLALLLFASIVSACSPGNVTVDGESEIQRPVEKKVKKHEAVSLPVNIYVNSEYAKSLGTENTFSRSITSVEIKDFDESTEIEFLERYGNDVRKQGINLQEAYKLLVITMSHELKGEKKEADREAFMLNAGSGLVIGDDELGLSNEFLSYQQEFIATDYRVGKTIDETGDIFLAIPSEFADSKNLQLKVLQKLDNVNKNIYVDLQN
ncbi:hypothetical protein [Sporosarcina sp. BP05]|uniref:hypothetical protein n=1 Tax=Sporosarcina sp. BP05 TaxID=2758726 RepID=UPI0021039E38|nr:hypothetical protein [Sporosarcina sp. BP05]